jgi:hypothetical protein
MPSPDSRRNKKEDSYYSPTYNHLGIGEGIGAAY